MVQQLMHKVYSVRKAFVQWNKNVFGRIEQELNLSPEQCDIYGGCGKRVRA